MSKIHIVLVCLLFSASAGTVRAQIEKSKNIKWIYDEEEVSPRDTMIYEKDPQKAFKLSLFHTLIPITTSAVLAEINDEHTEGTAIVMLYGILIGPSAGYFYSKMGGRGVGGIVLRTAVGVVASYAGIVLALNSIYGGNGDEGAAAVYYGGMGLVLISAIADIARVKMLTKRKYGGQHNSRLQIMPYPSIKTRSLGIQVRLQF